MRNATGWLLLGMLTATPPAWAAKKATPCKPRSSIDVQGGGIRAMALTPNGKTFVTANKDGTVRLFDVKGKAGKVLKGHTAEATCIAVSPDGKSIASGSEDKKAMLWELASGKQKSVLAAHDNTVSGVAFSPDGDALYTVSLDRRLIAWDAKTGDKKASWGGQGCLLNGIAVSRSTFPDGAGMAGSACNDGLARLWNLRSGKPVTALEGHGGEVQCVAFAQKALEGAHEMITGDNDGKIIVWDVGGKKSRLVVEAGWTDAVAFSPDNKLIVGGGNDGAAHGMFKLFDAATGKPINEQFVHEGNVTGVAFSSDSSTLYTASMDETIKSWDVAELKKGCN